VAGTATLYLLPDLDMGGTTWGVVEHVAVDEAQRSTGYGEALMREAMRLATPRASPSTCNTNLCG